VAINLAEIRSAVTAYVGTKVVSNVSLPVPDVPGTINPNEEFTFNVQAKNTPSPEGIRVINITYHLAIIPASVAQLKAPPSPPARAGNDLSLPILTPGSFVASMFLFPADNSLEPGDSDEIPGLKGKAVALGLANIFCHVHADVDLDFIFPKANLGLNTQRQVSVV
jgi:hypothetical protein